MDTVTLSRLHIKCQVKTMVNEYSDMCVEEVIFSRTK